MTAQMSLALEVAVRDLHGSCRVSFSRGRRVQCTLMARDGTWHDAEGDTIPEAIEGALENVDDAEFVQALRDIQCPSEKNTTPS